MTAPDMLVIRDLQLSRAGRPILRGVSLALAPGERLALVGPNGAGKSSLLHCLAGVLPIDAGTAALAGHGLNALGTAGRARLGLRMGFQITRVFPRMTVRENLWCASLAAHGVGAWPWQRQAERRRVQADVERLLNELALTDCADGPASVLSYARQRVLDLGLALAGPPPRLLVLDEPTAGLSPAEAQAMTALIDRMTDGLSLLFVEHDMGVVAALAHRITVLSEGSVVESGQAAVLARSPDLLAIYPGLAALSSGAGS